MERNIKTGDCQRGEGREVGR